jgi:hypothetical protein
MKRLLALFLIGAIAALGYKLWLAPVRQPATGSRAVVRAADRSEQNQASSPDSQQPTARGLDVKAPADYAAQIAQALRDGSATARDHALGQLLPQFVASDPNAAAAFALTWPPGTLRDELLRQVARSWLTKDTAGALKWLTALPEESDRRVAATAAIDFLAQNDPASAIELSLATGIGAQDGSVEHKAQLWAEEKLSEAEAWVLARPLGADRDRLLARIANVHAQRNAPEAAELVMNQMPPGAVRDEAVLGIVRRWAAVNPTEAAHWVSRFPPGPLFDHAVAELATFSK